MSVSLSLMCVKNSRHSKPNSTCLIKQLLSVQPLTACGLMLTLTSCDISRCAHCRHFVLHNETECTDGVR
jgi:hypothetical protein